MGNERSLVTLTLISNESKERAKSGILFCFAMWMQEPRFLTTVFFLYSLATVYIWMKLGNYIGTADWNTALGISMLAVGFPYFCPKPLRLFLPYMIYLVLMTIFLLISYYTSGEEFWEAWANWLQRR